MSKFFTPVKVGLLTIIVVAGILALIFMVKKGLKGASGSYRVYALFKDVTGLKWKSRVMLAGIDVGEIEQVSLTGTMARVVIRLRKDVVLRPDASVMKRQISVLGGYALVVYPGSKKGRLMEGARISNVQSEPSIGSVLDQMTAVAKVVRHITEDIRGVSKAIKDVFGKSEKESLKVILNSTASLAKAINRMVPRYNKAFQVILRNVGGISRHMNYFSSDIRVMVKSFLKDILAVGKRFNKLSGTTSDDVAAGVKDLRLAVKKVRQSADKVNQSIGHTLNIVRKIDKGKKGTLGALLNDRTLLDDTHKTIKKVGKVIDQVKTTVGEASGFLRTLTGLQTIFNIRPEFNLLSGTVKTYVQLRLQPKRDKYYLIEFVDDPRGNINSSIAVTETLSGTGQPLETTVTKTTTRNSDFKISFQLAKRFYFVTLRGGIKESTGGLGLDLTFFKERLNFSFDIFDFQREENPHLRAMVSVNLFRFFYIHAGVTDALHHTNRDIFVGFGFRFTDEDLKGILMFVPSSSLK